MGDEESGPEIRGVNEYNVFGVNLNTKSINIAILVLSIIGLASYGKLTASTTTLIQTANHVIAVFLGVIGVLAIVSVALEFMGNPKATDSTYLMTVFFTYTACATACLVTVLFTTEVDVLTYIVIWTLVALGGSVLLHDVRGVSDFADRAQHATGGRQSFLAAAGGCLFVAKAVFIVASVGSSTLDVVVLVLGSVLLLFTVVMVVASNVFGSMKDKVLFSMALGWLVACAMGEDVPTVWGPGLVAAYATASLVRQAS